LETIKNILVPKTKTQIHNHICKECGLIYNVKDEDIIYKLYNLMSIINFETPEVLLYYFDFKNNENYMNRREIQIEIKNKIININEQIKNWKIIYDNILNLIETNANNDINFYDSNLIGKIRYAIGTIEINNRGNSATFLITNKKTKEELKKYSVNLNIIEENIGDKIIVGRKCNPKVNEKSILIAKYKNQYKLVFDKNLAKNLYICINYD